MLPPSCRLVFGAETRFFKKKKKVFIVFMRERVTACAVRERYEAAAAAAGCRSPVHRTAVKQRPLMARVRSAHARATPDVSVGQDTCSDGL